MQNKIKIDKITKEFIEYLESLGISGNSIKFYKSDLSHFTGWLLLRIRSLGILAEELTQAIPFLKSIFTQEYKKFLIENKVSKKTINRRLSTLRNLSRFLLKSQILNFNFSEGLTNIPIGGEEKLQIHPIIEGFQKHLEAEKVSESTVKNYLADIRQFIGRIAENDITPKLLKAYLEEISKRSSQATSKRKIASLKKFIAWAQKQGLVKDISLFSKRKLFGKNIFKKAFYTSLQDKIIKRLEQKPRIQKIANSLFYNRPDWYRTYHDVSITNYIHIAILIIFSVALGFGTYEQFIKRTSTPLAYPTSLKPPNRYLSFQGRLTNQYGNPVTIATDLIFKLYDASTGGNTLWNAAATPCTITPDSDGIFSILLGSNCGGAIAATVFSENTNVWVGVKVGTDDEATPRIQIATVGYALNAETLQGFPIDATGSATKNTVVTMNNGGEIVIAESGPKIRSVSGTFAIVGRAMTLQTPDTSDGAITINPDGTGTLNLTFEGAAPGGGVGGFVNATNANITSGALYYGSVASNATGYNLLQLQSGATPVDKFVVSSAGNVTAAGNLSLTATTNLIFGGTTSLGETTAANDSGAYLVGTFDEFDNSASTNVQGVLNDLDAAITTGGGSSIWSLASGVIYPTSATNDLAIGGTTLAASMFGIDESAGNFYFGYDNSANPTLNFEATDGDAGEFGFNTNDAFYFSNANVGIGTTSPTRILGLGGTAVRNIGMERGTVSNTAGYALTINAGGATSGATDKAGGSLVLTSGLSTGTGTGQIQFWTSPALTTGGILTISATPTAGGTGYTAADTLTVTTGGTGGTVTVATVDGSGVILTLNTAPAAAGTGYTTGTGKVTTGGTGTGATINITAITSTADSTLAQRMTIDGAGTVAVANTLTAGGKEVLKYQDYATTRNTFWSKGSIFIPEFYDAFVKMDVRGSVTVSGQYVSYSAANLFNGNYEDSGIIVGDENNTAVVTIDLKAKGESGITYSSGYLYVTSYYTYGITSVSCRSRNTNTQVWVNCGAAVDIDPSANQVWKIPTDGQNFVDAFEVTIVGRENGTYDGWVTEIAYERTRPEQSFTPVVNLYNDIEFWTNLRIKDSTMTTKASILTDGTALFGNTTVYSTASLGSEKVTNGTFADASVWTWGTGWAHDAVNLEADHTAGNVVALEQNVSAVAGEIYQVVFTVLNRTAGSVTPQVGGVNGAAVSSNSTSTQQIRATGTGNLKFTPTTDFDGSVDTVSVKLITGGDLKLAGLLTGGGTTGIKVTAAGSVGIGTTAPSNELEVVGDIELTNLLDNDTSNFFDGGCSATTSITGIDSTGAITCTAITGVPASSIAFSGITSGTNTQAAMWVGAGASLTYSGGVASDATINANKLLGGTWAIPGTIGSGTANTGAFTTLSASTSLTTPTIIGSTSLALKPSSDATTAIQLQNAAGTSVLNVDTTNGRVGIGTTGPGSMLEVAGKGQFGTAAATSSQLTVLGGAGGGDLITLTRTTGATLSYGWSLAGAALVFQDITNNVGNLSLYSSSGKPNMMMGIRSNATNTAAGLDGYIHAEDSDTGAADLAGGSLYLTSGIGDGAGAASKIYFQTPTVLGSGTTQQTLSTRMTIDGTGNVGIGITAPSNELEVVGDIELTNLYDNDASNFFDGGCSATTSITGIDSTGAITCTAISGVPASSIAFSGITSGTNTQAAMWVGSGSSLTYAGGTASDATINANQLLGGTWAIPGTIGSGTPNTGAFTTLSANSTGNALTLSGTGSNIAFSGAGLAQITTAASQHLALMPGGNVGIGTTTPTATLDILGTNSGTTPILKATNGYIDVPVGTQLRNDLVANDLIMHLPFNVSPDTSRGISGVYTRTDTASGATATYTDENNLIVAIQSNSFTRTEKSYISRGEWIEDARRNMILYSSNENAGTPPTGWTNSPTNPLSTADSSTTYRKHLTYSMRLIAGASAGQLYRATTAVLTSSANYPVTAYVYNGTASAIGGTVDVTVAKLYSSLTISSTTYTNMGGGWWLLRANLTGTGASPNVGLQVEAGKTVYLDAIQIDGTTANAGVNYPSTYIYNTSAVYDRGTETLYYPAYYNYGKQHLTQDQGTYSFWFKPNFATSELASPDKPYLMETGTTACQDSAATTCLIKIYMDGADDKIYAAMYNSTDYTTVAVSSATQSFSAYTDHFVSVRWNSSTGAIILNVDGVETTDSNSAWTPPAFNTGHNIYIGSPALTATTGNRANSLISDVASFDRALTANEVAQIYNAKAPIQDFERKDQVMLTQTTSGYQIGNIRMNGTVYSGGVSTGAVGATYIYSTYTGFMPGRGLISDLAALYPFNFTLTNSKGNGGTFSRADVANGTASYQREPDMEITTVNANVPRFDRGTVPAAYTSKGPGNPGLWMEASRKNVALYSSFEPDTGWTAEAGITKTTDTTFQVHGTSSSKLVNGASAQRYYQAIDFTGAAVQHQISAYAYLGNSAAVGNAVAAANVGLYAGTNITGSALTTTYTHMGKGWYRMTATFTATATTWYVGFYLPASQTVYVDAFQVERTGADAATYYPTTYIPTTTTAVTRAAETLTYAAPTGLQPDRGSVSIWFKPQYNRAITGDNTDKYIFEITNYLRMYLDGTTNDRIQVDAWTGAAWTNILTTTTNAVNQFAWNHLIFTWNANGSNTGRINGTAVSTTYTSWTPQNPVGQTLYVGSNSSGANQADALISELAFFNRILDSSETYQLYNNNAALIDYYNTVSPVLQSDSGLQLSQAGNLNISGNFLGGLGSATAPTFGFGSDTNTGIFSPTSDVLGISTNGTEQLRINSSGNVGIGTTDPSSFRLEVAGNIGPEADNTRNLGSASRYYNTIYANNIVGTGALGYWSRNSGSGYLYPATITDSVGIGTTAPVGLLHVAATAPFVVTSAGQVGIGSTSPASLLDVAGTAWLRGVAGGTSGLYVNSSGNVGVGTTAPSNELEVVGDIELTNLYDNDASNFFDGGCSATTTITGIDSTGAITCTDITGVPASSIAFSGITSGSNTQANMSVGTGAALNYAGSGTINASSLIGGTWAVPGTIGSTTPSTGAFTTLSASTSLTTPTIIGSTSLALKPSSDATTAIQLQNAAGTSILNIDTTNGRVGIGTTSPAQQLDVNGNFRISTGGGQYFYRPDNTTLGLTINAGAANNFFTANNGSLIFQSTSASITFQGSSISFADIGSPYTHRADIKLGSAGTAALPTLFLEADPNTGLFSPVADNFAVTTAGTERVRIDGNGNVGIGTTSPSSKLEIASTTHSIVTIDAGTGSYVSAIYLERNGVADWTFGRPISTSGRFAILEDNLAASERFTILEGGNVGIGTTGPTSKLQVSGGTGNYLAMDFTDVYPRLKFAGNGGVGGVINRVTGTDNLYFGESGDSGNYFFRGEGNVRVQNGITVGGNYMATAAPSYGMIIEGNVGIGTTNPTYKLDVNGDIRIASGSDLYIGTYGLNDNASVSGGASLVGLYDDAMTYIAANTTVQGAIKELDTAIGTVSGSAGGWTDDGSIVRLTTIGDEVGIGTTSPSGKLEIASDAVGQIPLVVSGYSDSQTADLLQIKKYGAATPSFVVTSAGNIGIGTTGPGARLDVRDGNLYLTDTDMTHGMVDAFPTNTFFVVQPSHATVLGARFTGISQSAAFPGIEIEGIIGVADPTDTTPGIWMSGNKKSGVNRVALGALETVFQVATGIRGSDTPLLTILGSGNVGIGTTGPGAKLEVAGNTLVTNGNITTSFTDDLTYTNWNVMSKKRTTGGVLQSGDQIGSYIWRGYDGSAYSDAAAITVAVEGTPGVGDMPGSISFRTTPDGSSTLANVMRLHQTGGLSLGTSYLATDPGAGSMIISGNVGIGTTSPGYNLDVRGSQPSINLTATTGTNYLYSRYSNTGGTLYLGIDRSTGGGLVTGSSAYAGIVAKSGNYPLQLATNDAIRVTVDGSGNVGIGTTGPGYKLDVNGDIRIAGGNDLYIGTYGLNDNASANSGASLLGLYDDAMTYIAANTTVQGAIKELDTAIGTVSGSAGGWTDDGSIVRLTTIGDEVGIGTTSPSGKLEIASDAVGQIPLVVSGYSDSQTADLLQVKKYGAATANFVIDSAGQVGIGTTGPTHKLELTDHTTAAGGIAIGADVELYRSAANNLTLASGDNLNLALNTNLIFGGTTSLGETTAANDSGAYLVGTFDEFDYSNSNNVQGVLNDIDLTIGGIIGGTTGLWTDSGTLTYLTSTADDFAVGANSLTAPLSVDVSANTVRIGTGATANAVLNMYASDGDTGSLTYTTSDAWAFEGGNVGIGTTGPTQKLDISGKIALDGTVVAYRPTTMTSTLIFGNGGTSLSHTTGNEGYYNTALGISSLPSITTGYGNTALGYNSLPSLTTGYLNTAIGYYAGNGITTGSSNFIMGNGAGSVGTGGSNVAIGDLALGIAGNRTDNVAIGNQALYQAQGTRMVGIGRGAGVNNTTGGYSVYIGGYAGSGADTGAFTATNSVVIGGFAGYGNQTGSSNNVLIGYQSGYSVSSGASNIFIGANSGYRQTTLSNLFIIDNQLRADATTEITNSILYGVMAAAPANQTLRINATALISGNVGIGTTSPGAALEVAGQVKITGGTPGANKVLTSDANGLASWSTVGGSGIGDDSLDFAQFEDTLDLDANLILNQAAYTWVQNFTGTTTTGLTYNANSLTSGSALAIASTGTAVTGDLATVTLSGSNAANTGSLLSLTNSGTANANTTFYIKHYATGTGNLALRVDDVSGDTTPFVIDGAGNVGIGTTAPSNELEVVGDIELTNLLDNDASNFFDGGCSATTSITGIDSTGAITCTAITGVPASSIAFTNITSGSNTQANMSVGTGAALNYAGSGTINASSLIGATWAAPLAIGGTTAAAGTFTTVTANTGVLPDADDGAYLGQAGTAFADLFLAEGGVINWDSSDATLTQTGNVVALAGADFDANTNIMTNIGNIGTDFVASTGALNLAAILTMAANASITMTSGTGQFSQTYTGTTTDASTLVADSLTSGDGYNVSSAATAFTGNLIDVTLSGNNANNTGSLLSLTNSGVNNTNTALYIKHYATGTGNLAMRVDDVSGDTTPFVIDGAGNVGIGTTGPAAKLHPLATTEQLRLGYDVSNYASFTTGSTGDLTISPTGGQLMLADTATLNVGGLTNVAYNAFANATDTPAATAITADNDLFVGGDLELKGGLYLTGKNIYNVVGGVSTGAISFAADPAAINSYNSLSYGSWLVQNATNNGIAALMVNQTKGGDIFTASASGTPKFVIANSGYVGIGTAEPNYNLDVIGTVAAGEYFTYEKAITVTNSGSTLSSYETILSLDTATLISAGKMQSDCDDMRFVLANGDVLSYYLESGCNTANTQVWVKIPSLPNGDTIIYFLYGNSTASSKSKTYSGNFIFMGNASCPSGWTRVSALDNKLPSGAASYGGTGGADTHTHTFSLSGLSNTAAATIGTSLTFDLNLLGHTHSVTVTSNGSASNFPAYIDIVFCSNDSNPVNISSSQIALFDAAPPSPWSNTTALNSKFFRGAASYGGTGGADTHVHTLSGNLPANATSGKNITTGTGVAAAAVSHTHALTSKDSASSSSLPPYLELIPANPSTITYIPSGAITASSAVPPMGWSIFSSLNGNFARGNSTYGATGGASSYSHTFSQASDQASTSVTRTTGAINVPTSTHTHTVTGSSTSDTSLPSYMEVVYIKKSSQNASVSYVAGSETSSQRTNAGLIYDQTLTIQGATNKALVIFNQTGDQDIFTASVSGIPKFVIDNSGNVGIGTTGPGEKLHVNGLIRIERATDTDNDSPGITAVSNDDFLYNGVYLNHYGLGFHTPVNQTNRGVYASGYFGIDLFTHGTNRLSILQGGNVGIGTTGPGGRLVVKGVGTTTGIGFQTQNSSGTALVTMLDSGNVLFNTTNEDPVANNVAGAVIDSDGTGNFSSDGTNPLRLNRLQDGAIVGFRSGGVTQGTISISGVTVSYNAFTGSHYGLLSGSANRGELVSLTGNNTRLNEHPDSEIIYGITRTTRENDPKVLGSYLALQEPTQSRSNSNPDLVMVVGNGDMWVVDMGQDLEIGNYLISSSTAGHAMKDDGSYSPAYVVARVAEPVHWDNITETIDGKKHKKISVLFENYKSWYDPDVYLTDAGDLKITANSTSEESMPTSEVSYSLQTSAGKIIDRIGAFAEVIAGNIRAGAIETKDLATQSFVAFQGTIDNLLITNGLVSPVVQTNLISPLADSSDVVIKLGKQDTSQETSSATSEESYGKLAIQNGQGEEVASIDSSGSAEFKMASISGELYADTIKSKTLDEIQELLRKVETDQDLLAEASTWNTNTATDSAQIINSLQTMNLYVTDQAAISSLSVSNSLSLGTDLVIQTSSINTLTAPLALQSLAMAPVEIMAGKIRIETNGDVKIQGNVEIAGNLNVKGTVSGKEIVTEKLIIAQPVQEGTPSTDINTGEITSNATAGTATIPAGISEIIINNPNIEDRSLVYVTPTSSTENNVLFVKSKEIGKFTVGFTNPIDVDVNFNWWVVQVRLSP